jgi:hypothetical protein
MALRNREDRRLVRVPRQLVWHLRYNPYVPMTLFFLVNLYIVYMRCMYGE